jgi:hypothetical protein
MTANPASNMPIDPLDLYLDGMLEGPELAAFEQRLAADASLRRLVDQHRRIDRDLKKSFKPPSISISLPAVAPAATPQKFPAAAPRPGSYKFPIAPRFLLYAAVVAIAGIVGWWQMSPPTVSIKMPQLSAGQVYANLTSKGFQPEFVCTTDEAFNETMEKRFGQGLLIASAPNIELIGWAYSDGYKGAVVSPKELILMAKVDGRETVVFMDKAKNAPFFGIKKEAPPGMNVFKRRVGDIVLYELTSLPTPVLSDRAYDPATKK